VEHERFRQSTLNSQITPPTRHEQWNAEAVTQRKNEVIEAASAEIEAVRERHVSSIRRPGR